MKNIEIKARCVDPQTVRRSLAKRMICPVRQMRQVDTYFVVPRGRLKLRETEGAAAELIQYHRPDARTAHASDYLIVPVSEPALLRQALSRSLGIQGEVVKRRELYLWEHTRVHLDEVDGLGSFLELETVITTQTEEEAAAECRAVQAALCVQDQDLVSGSYADLLFREA
jgi:predicted adenylyl cyclase CyaB